MSDRMHAAELDDAETVLRVIVGTAVWATQHLGGRWQDSPKCGPGWTYHGGDDWRPPQPGPDCVWNPETRSWDCPAEPEPEA